MLRYLLCVVAIASVTLFAGPGQAQPIGVDPGAAAYPAYGPRQERHVTFNGRPITLAQIAQVEQYLRPRAPLPDGDYWYDDRTGASGRWGGPPVVVLAPGMNLGGPLPSNCSTGGTGLFVNGRELHPIEVQRIRQFLGSAIPGRYWADARGNVGREGGPVLFNLVHMAQAARARMRR